MSDLHHRRYRLVVHPNESPTGLLLCTPTGAAEHGVPTLPDDDLVVLYELRSPANHWPSLTLDQVRAWADRLREEGHSVVFEEPSR